MQSTIPDDSQLFGRLLESLPLPAVLITKTGTIQETNSAASWWSGVSRDNARGHALWQTYWTPLCEEERSSIREAVQRFSADPRVPARWIASGCLLLKLGASDSVLAMGTPMVTPRFVRSDGAPSQDEFQQLERIASHDLQETVRGIRTQAQLLERRLGGTADETTRGMLGEVQRQAADAFSMLDALAAFAGSVCDGFAEVDAGSCLQAALDRVAQSTPLVEAELTIEPLPRVIAPPAGLITVFEHLIRNSLENRAPQRPLQLEVCAIQRGGFAVINFRDNGVGIDPEHQAEAFQLFSRLARERGTGRGVGLATVRRIAACWTGRVWLESDRGKGCAVSLSVPTARECDVER